MPEVEALGLAASPSGWLLHLTLPDLGVSLSFGLGDLTRKEGVQEGG